MKKIITFFYQYTDVPGGSILFLFLTSGISYALILAVVNRAAAFVSTGHAILEFRLFLMFVILSLIHLYAKKTSLKRSIQFCEEIIENIRLGIIGKIRYSELRFLEQTGTGIIYARLTEDTRSLTRTVPFISMAMVNVTSLISVFFYLATQSIQGFLFIAGLFGFSLMIYKSVYGPARAKILEARKKEIIFFERLNDVLFGFKEIRINYQKNEDLFADVHAITSESEQLKIDAQVNLNNCFIIVNTTYYLMIAGIIFILPVFNLVENSAVVSLVSSLLFIWGPLLVAFKTIPLYMMTSVSVDNLVELNNTIDSFNFHVPDPPEKIRQDFEKISIKSVNFSYKDKDGSPLFDVGPIDFTLKKGEIVFVIGGNGSGKSTFMKLLTGLYYPDAGGELMINGKQVTNKTYQSYREYFTTIYTDFHLFEKPYSLQNVDPAEINKLLKIMEIDHKTSFRDQKFTNIDLSTGQKKRLACIICLLEDKPIYVLDEWAADQDPEFKKYFYETFLDNMRARNKTVVAVSHDDRYFHTADRIVKMEMGKIVSLS
jgi:putative ATP-binding cassette transporter